MSPVAAQQFMDFLQAPQVTAILQRRGYTVPE
jgi:ABC-type molybdate transport system substrate-binding protein